MATAWGALDEFVEQLRKGSTVHSNDSLWWNWNTSEPADLSPSSLTTIAPNVSGAIDSLEPPRNWYALLIIPLIFCGFFGNIMVIIAIVTEKQLKTTTNYFLMSLAVADAGVSIGIMPFSMMADFYGECSRRVAARRPCFGGAAHLPLSDES